MDVAVADTVHTRKPVHNAPCASLVGYHAWGMVTSNNLWHSGGAHDLDYTPEHIVEMMTRVIEAQKVDPGLTLAKWIDREGPQDWAKKISSETEVQLQDPRTKTLDMRPYEAALRNWTKQQLAPDVEYESLLATDTRNRGQPDTRHFIPDDRRTYDLHCAQREREAIAQHKEAAKWAEAEVDNAVDYWFPPEDAVVENDES